MKLRTLHIVVVALLGAMATTQCDRASPAGPRGSGGGGEGGGPIGGGGVQPGGSGGVGGSSGGTSTGGTPAGSGGRGVGGGVGGASVAMGGVGAATGGHGGNCAPPQLYGPFQLVSCCNGLACQGQCIDKQCTCSGAGVAVGRSGTDVCCSLTGCTTAPDAGLCTGGPP
jgi:hypothetical protein